ncbi:putative inorganic carbon transporter subunit DabA, partial [Halochromatium sp.]
MTPTSHPDPTPAPLPEQIDAACNRIAPVWPLDRFVAVNPFHGLRDQRFEQAAETMRRIAGARMYMPRSYYREQIEAGRITDEDLSAAAARCGSDLSAADLRQAAAVDAKPPSAPQSAPLSAPLLASQAAPQSAPQSAQVPLLTSVLDDLDADDWSSFVVERISHHCAAYFDMGQATWKRPWQGMSLYESWRRFAAMDYSTTMMGQNGMRARVKALPESPRDCIESAIRRLGIPADAELDYMHAALMDIGGWAAWARLLRWEQELIGGEDETIVELLAIRLAWDVLVYEHKASPDLRKRWREVCRRLSHGKPAAKPTPEPQDIEHILLTAFELSYQRQLMADMRNGPAAHSESPTAQRPVIQAAFCIDVRSEVVRRSFETICPKAQTLGFAGFFGVPIEHVPFGAVDSRSHMPVLLTPKYRVCSEVHDADRDEAEQALETQRRRTGIHKS